MRQIVSLLFEAGAAEVHVRVACPPIISPCFYGVDMPDEDDLVAHGKAVEDVRGLVGATSLAYLSLAGHPTAVLRLALVYSSCFRDPSADQVCERQRNGQRRELAGTDLVAEQPDQRDDRPDQEPDE